MLHGKPGVGKIAAAEAVAQATKRPLFLVLADVNLTQIFYLAHLWDCILLMDEDDIFLTTRGPSNSLEANNPVSG